MIMSATLRAVRPEHGEAAPFADAAAGTAPSPARPKAPSRHDLPQAERRRRIVDAAIRVIAVEGLSLTTIEKVARQAGVSPGTVIFQFHSKDELLLACLDAVAREFDEARVAAVSPVGDDPERALLRLIDMVFDPVVATPEKLAVWYAFWGEAPTRRVYMERVGQGDQNYYDDLERLFAALAKAGRLSTEQGIAVRSFAGLLEILWQEIIVEADRFDRVAAIRMARTHLASLLVRSHSGV